MASTTTTIGKTTIATHIKMIIIIKRMILVIIYFASTSTVYSISRYADIQIHVLATAAHDLACCTLSVHANHCFLTLIFFYYIYYLLNPSIAAVKYQIAVYNVMIT